MVRYIVIAALLASSAYFKYSADKANKVAREYKVELNQTRTELTKVKNQLMFEYATIEAQLVEIEKLKNTPVVEKPVIIYKTLIQEVPAEVVTQTANEDTNAIINDIISESKSFSLRNKN